LRFLLPPEHGGGIGIAARHTIAVEPGRASAMLDLAQARTIALQVVGPQQEPAVEAGALLLPISGGKVVTGLLERVPLDSVGRARLSVLPGEWFLLVTDGRDFHAEVLQVDSGDAPITANVRLEPLASLRGTLLTADGKPAVDARITLATSGHTGSDFPPLDRCLVTLLHPLNSEFVGRTKVAADGSFEVRFLEVKNASSNASAHRDGSTLQFELRAGREVELRFK
jgi:hypothetical protein